jgi:8-oxo-dGTP pyrophosphatase MutT (NUDIX family)
MSGLERVGGETRYEGRIVSVREETFRYPDGGTAEREVVVHPGAVAVVAHDDEHVYLVRQPREPVEEPALLELPAGKLDRRSPSVTGSWCCEGESPLEAMKRELVEEIGMEADEWRELKRIYTSPGFAREEVRIYVASGLRAVEHEPDPGERIEIVRWPIEDLTEAIIECKDSKTLIGLLLFERDRR